jgi:phosphoribosylamine--glycine ligase
LPINLGEDQWLFQAGTKLVGEEIQTNGGRVIAVTSLGADIPAALDRSKKLANEVHFAGKFYRTDIGMDLMQLLS